MHIFRSLFVAAVALALPIGLGNRCGRRKTASAGQDRLTVNTDTNLTDTDNFLVDVRVVMEAGEIDFCARPVRVWGWNYRTLQGHLEMGQMDNPLIRVGFALFGRRMQKKFARRALARMHALVLDQVGGRRDQPTGDLPEPTLESVVVERAASDIRLNQAFHRHR